MQRSTSGGENEAVLEIAKNEEKQITEPTTDTWCNKRKNE